ncbi:MAG TPA: glycosyltransferase [Crenalkalicoccus sp.]|nr:glycosyltransferase [Crenalkalicoccus sp.]
MLDDVAAASRDAAALVSAGLAELSPGIVLLGFPEPASSLDPAQLIVQGVGVALRPPLSWHRVELSGGPLLLLLGRAQPALAAGAELEMAEGDAPAQRYRIGAPLRFAEFAAGAGPRAVLGLLRFVAGKATGILRHSEDTGLSESCLGLAETVLAPERTALPVALCGHDMMMWALPRGAEAAEGTWYAISKRRVRKVTISGGTIILPDRRFEDGYLLPPEGEGPIHLAPAQGRPPSLSELGKRKDAQSLGFYRAGLSELARRAGSDTEARRLLRDLQLLAPVERPHHYAAVSRPFGAALELALCDHSGGAFLRGWIRDPLGLVAGLTLHCPFGERPLEMAQLGRFGRPDLIPKYAESPHGGAGPKPGFAVHLPDIAVRPVAQWSLRIELTTGDPISLIAPAGIVHAESARDAVLGAIAPQEVTPALLGQCIAPAVERLHRAVLADRKPPETTRIGPAIAEPALSIVVPVYRNLRFLKHQYAAFARDRALREAELIYVLDSPEQRAELDHLLRGLYGLYHLPVTLVVQAANYGYASASNAGAAEARAPFILFLNSDVVPAARGWSQHLLGALAKQPKLAAVGPKLLFEDGSLQHAGLFFEQLPDGEWCNAHYYKGFPRHYPAAQESRLVPGVTGAALCVRRDAFEGVGGFTTDYVIGDYEDSDLCLKLRAGGGEIAYVPRAELYHFERQSIRDHAGYSRTLAARYNRRLHHQRWAPAIEQLMARSERRAARGH